ncbi:unnamed protein product, partial [Closterium sp. NIES-54]
AVESLGEEVGEVVGGGDFANGDVTILDKVANEVVAKLDVFGATMKDGFLGEVNGTVVVTPQGGPDCGEPRSETGSRLLREPEGLVWGRGEVLWWRRRGMDVRDWREAGVDLGGGTMVGGERREGEGRGGGGGMVSVQRRGRVEEVGEGGGEGGGEGRGGDGMGGGEGVRWRR